AQLSDIAGGLWRYPFGGWTLKAFQLTVNAIECGCFFTVGFKFGTHLSSPFLNSCQHRLGDWFIVHCALMIQFTYAFFGRVSRPPGTDDYLQERHYIETNLSLWWEPPRVRLCLQLLRRKPQRC